MGQISSIRLFFNVKKSIVIIAGLVIIYSEKGADKNLGHQKKKQSV